MIKDLLKKTQPVVYQALENALTNRHVSHSYLFLGPAGTPKKQTAVLMAQSLLCEKARDDFACEECGTCRRVAAGEHLDVVLLNGDPSHSIKIADTHQLQSQFSQTAYEKGGRKIGIINGAEFLTVDAQNDLLKFLEEPEPDVTVILTSENTDRILPTILSRCTLIPFLPTANGAYYDEAVAAGVDPQDAYFLAGIVRDPQEIQELAADRNYEAARDMLKEYVQNPDRLNDLLLYFMREVKVRERERMQRTLSLFFDLLIQYYRDAILGDAGGASWYHDAVKKAAGKDRPYAQMMLIASEQKDKCGRSNDLSLVMDQTVYRLEETQNE